MFRATGDTRLDGEFLFNDLDGLLGGFEVSVSHPSRYIGFRKHEGDYPDPPFGQGRRNPTPVLTSGF